ncbi:MAG: hypothetical protein FWD14_03100 [Treponema sp.]|nr:hypothetical protein [Treponema sp.]
MKKLSILFFAIAFVMIIVSCATTPIEKLEPGEYTIKRNVEFSGDNLTIYLCADNEGAYQALAYIYSLRGSKLERPDDLEQFVSEFNFTPAPNLRDNLRTLMTWHGAEYLIYQRRGESYEDIFFVIRKQGTNYSQTGIRIFPIN